MLEGVWFQQNDANAEEIKGLIDEARQLLDQVKDLDNRR